MHTVHHTEAFILKTAPSGEANIRVWLFTKEFGLLMAMVQGVRKPGAKLQSHIIDYAYISADLVKGKDVWRLVSASIIDNPSAGKLRDPLLRAYVRTLSMLARFLIGEGTHPEIFAHIEECLSVVKEGGYDAAAFDAFSLWKISALLGYIAPSDIEEPLLEQRMSAVLTAMTDEMRKRFVESVQSGITESHL